MSVKVKVIVEYHRVSTGSQDVARTLHLTDHIHRSGHLYRQINTTAHNTTQGKRRNGMGRDGTGRKGKGREGKKRKVNGEETG